MKRIDMRNGAGENELSEALNRSQDKLSAVEETVNEIIRTVRAGGDQALRDYAMKFDRCELADIRVSQEEIENAASNADPEFVRVLCAARDNIADWHSLQKFPETHIRQEGRLLSQLVLPIRRVGLYVPGGSFPLPSTVLMNAIPASVAGVPEIVLVTPPTQDGSVNPNILVAARIAGVHEIYRSGGAQAIAALAYGTESIKRVDKIFGPGNIYVTAAKKAVYGQVGIDMLAGPSEVLVIADRTANPAYVAADLLAQAEHDRLSAAIVVSDSPELLDAVEAQVARQLALLPQDSLANDSLRDYGLLILADSLIHAAEISNEIAPEHLEIISGKHENEVLAMISNAGSIFLGEFTPEPLGDYYAGVNHTLPTSGTARFYSPLSAYDFVKRTSVLSYSKERLGQAAGDVILFAKAEGLMAHAASIAARFNDSNGSGKEVQE